MKLTRRRIKNILVVILLTTFMTWFFYAHENLPKPIRAATALLETPVAIASGLSYYCKLGLPVYDTFWAVILTNLIFSVILVYLADKFFYRKNKRQKKIK
jgi:membrane protein implicated in regulation of membrane protease activity